MLNIPGRAGRTCEGPTRRELHAHRLARPRRVCICPASFSRRKQHSASNIAEKYAGARGFGNAKNVIMIFLQGGPSHIDIWDPKPDAPANIRGDFKPIKTKIPGTHISEHMPMLAKTHRQGDAHPLDELHAQRPVQPHGRHLPDADRLHARQGLPVGPARAAEPRGLPDRRQSRQRS